MSTNETFANIINNSLYDVDDIGNELISDASNEPILMFTQLPPIVFPFGYMIISSTFAYFEEGEDDQSYY
tara:strand:+ start:139 stop:348 length:210 start_codon:yes stop_codon:yes gene_type:complete